MARSQRPTLRLTLLLTPSHPAAATNTEMGLSYSCSYLWQQLLTQLILAQLQALDNPEADTHSERRTQTHTQTHVVTKPGCV
jgi:hypothetical protein